MKTRYIRCRLTEEERETIDRKAKAYGLTITGVVVMAVKMLPEDPTAIHTS